MTTSAVAANGRVARRIHVRGVVQGVGFRPYVFRLAQTHHLAGWVNNADDGVHVHVEGSDGEVEAFVGDLSAHAPPAARIAAVTVVDADVTGLSTFDIRSSVSSHAPTTRMSPDLAVCDDCVRELFDAVDRRHHYAYINCTNCGPRYSIVRALPYDRPQTTMAGWPLCERCAREYDDPADRRFHAQPVACPACGPRYRLVRSTPESTTVIADTSIGVDAIRDAARLLSDGFIVGIKGIGGYHLACDAANADAVRTLRERKVRKEKPFAVMVRDLDVARGTAYLDAAAEQLLRSTARPIVLAPARIELPGVAPDNPEIGLMLPYAPLHHLLFAFGAPARIVVTSGNRSDEPIAYHDHDAKQQLTGLVDAMLVGERPIARRVDDSVVRATAAGSVMLRRARGYAPAVVAQLPCTRPILALGADLKSTVTLVVDGQACVSQHLGDLEHYDAYLAFRETIDDLLTMYAVDRRDLLVVHDAHPAYRSTRAAALSSCPPLAVQHHRAHIASVLAEHEEWDTPVVGAAFDGTGYGDDGTIWGGELFVGSVRDGFTRAAHLLPAQLPGGDAAARSPVQAAAGFVAALDDAGDLIAPPFEFPPRYASARALVASGVRSFITTSAGRLFDTVAALCGFTRSITFEGQAAIWLEHMAGTTDASEIYRVELDGDTLDWRPALQSVLRARGEGVSPARVARAFHLGLASGIAEAAAALATAHAVSTVVLSGGVFQNRLLSETTTDALTARGLRVLTNAAVPANDGGISLGQAALAAALTSRRVGMA